MVCVCLGVGRGECSGNLSTCLLGCVLVETSVHAWTLCSRLHCTQHNSTACLRELPMTAAAAACRLRLLTHLT